MQCTGTRATTAAAPEPPASTTTAAAPEPQPQRDSQQQYLEKQGWCRVGSIKYFGEDPPFLFSEENLSRDDCEKACNEKKWCVAYGWKDTQIASERCRLHLKNMDDIDSKKDNEIFNKHSGHPDIKECTTQGNGNATSYCYIKKIGGDCNTSGFKPYRASYMSKAEATDIVGDADSTKAFTGNSVASAPYDGGSYMLIE